MEDLFLAKYRHVEYVVTIPITREKEMTVTSAAPAPTATKAPTKAKLDASKGEGTELYRAGCEALVSEASAESTFAKMISCAYSHSTEGTFSKEVRETEKHIKDDFQITSMPGPWRSAKSVITSAMKLSIKLIDDNGAFCGKTFLQNAIKAKRMETKTEWTNDSYAKKIIMLLINHPPYLDIDNINAQVMAFVDSDLSTAE